MTEHVSTLELAWRVREEGASGLQTRREYLDFVIDGKPLGKLANLGDSYVSFLGWTRDDDDYTTGLLKQLLLEEPSELESGRRMLCVCPECGDIGCGALTAIVKREDDHFVWTEFGVEEPDWWVGEEPLVHLDGFEELGPYRFEASQYRDALLHRPPRPPEMTKR